MNMMLGQQGVLGRQATLIVRDDPTARASVNLLPSWREFYRGREGFDYVLYFKRRYADYLQAIHREIVRRNRLGTILEVGAGLGTATRALALGPAFAQVCLDNDRQMADACRSLVDEDVWVINGDMRYHRWLKADIIHGHGVLEHLEDIDIYRTLEAHRTSGASVAIHYVPGEGYRKPSRGDERLMPLQWWVDKWDVTEAFTFNCGKDYVLIWRF